MKDFEIRKTFMQWVLNTCWALWTIISVYDQMGVHKNVSSMMRSFNFDFNIKILIVLKI